MRGKQQGGDVGQRVPLSAGFNLRGERGGGGGGGGCYLLWSKRIEREMNSWLVVDEREMKSWLVVEREMESWLVVEGLLDQVEASSESPGGDVPCLFLAQPVNVLPVSNLTIHVKPEL